MMRPEYYEGEYWSVETSYGTFVIPLDVEDRKDALRDYVEGEIIAEPEIKDGWVGRLRASEDCTPWESADSETEIRQQLNAYLEEE